MIPTFSTTSYWWSLLWLKNKTKNKKYKNKFTRPENFTVYTQTPAETFAQYCTVFFYKRKKKMEGSHICIIFYEGKERLWWRLRTVEWAWAPFHPVVPWVVVLLGGNGFFQFRSIIGLLANNSNFTCLFQSGVFFFFF